MTLALVPGTEQEGQADTTADHVVPATVDGLQATADAYDAAIQAWTTSGWTLAASVWAWTRPSKGGRPKRDDNSSGSYSISAFARLKIRGLTSRDSVRRYREAWERAIEEGYATAVRPGEPFEIPDVPFSTYVLEHDQSQADQEQETDEGGKSGKGDAEGVDKAEAWLGKISKEASKITKTLGGLRTAALTADEVDAAERLAHVRSVLQQVIETATDELAYLDASVREDGDELLARMHLVGAPAEADMRSDSTDE
jgi:hypothetical protein